MTSYLKKYHIFDVISVLCDIIFYRYDIISVLYDIIFCRYDVILVLYDIIFYRYDVILLNSCKYVVGISRLHTLKFLKYSDLLMLF